MPIRTNRCTAAVLGLGTSLFLLAQTPLQPQWIHTWPFGMDEYSLMSYVPPWMDNQVVVDPITGLIHTTVSDEDMLYSPRAELLYTFSPDGTELTDPVIPVIGNVPFPGLYTAPVNAIALTDLTVHNGKVYSGHTYRLMVGGNDLDWGHFYAGGPLGGDRWKATLGDGSIAPGMLRLAAGPNGLMLGNYGFDQQGVFRWRAELDITPRQLVAAEQVTFALAGNEVHRIVMSDGTVMPPSIPVHPLTERFDVRNDHIHHARVMDSDQVVVGKMDLNGQVLWEQSFNLVTQPVITELVVDDLGRTWISCSILDPSLGTMVGGYLLGVDANGTILGTYTYGDALHSMATDGSALYITGWSANTGTETFLIRVDIDLITQLGGPTIADGDLLRAWPNPASRSLFLQLPDRTGSLGLLDVQGRVVRSWAVPRNSPQIEVEINDLAPGRYMLRATARDAVFRTAVVITH